MGWEESAIAVLIGHFLVAFARPRRLGTVLGADGMLRLVPGLVRVPDVSFLARGKPRVIGAVGSAYLRLPPTWLSRSSARVTPRPRSPGS